MPRGRSTPRALFEPARLRMTKSHLNLSPNTEKTVLILCSRPHATNLSDAMPGPDCADHLQRVRLDRASAASIAELAQAADRSPRGPQRRPRDSHVDDSCDDHRPADHPNSRSDPDLPRA